MSANVAAIMGTTASLSDLGDVVDALDSQFSVIEKTLNLVGQNLVSDVKDAVKSAESMEELFLELSNSFKLLAIE